MNLYGKEFILQRDECPIHYWLTGRESAPLIVLTHGAGVDHHEWELQLPALQPEYRILAWDIRGHGRSRPMGTSFTIRRVLDDLLALLDALGVAQAVFIGHSMGGNVHQELVCQHPERVCSLVMLGCTCNTTSLTALEQFYLKWGLAALPYWPFLRWQSAWISAVTQRGRDAIFHAMKQMTLRDFADIMAATASCLHYEPDYRIRKPMLIVAGEKDMTGNIRKVARTWAARDSAECIFIPNAGHAANLDNPEFFNQVVLKFLHEHA